MDGKDNPQFQEFITDVKLIRLDELKGVRVKENLLLERYSNNSNVPIEFLKGLDKKYVWEIIEHQRVKNALSN